jgi:UDP-N-acetylmuramyl pentapeptide synthase
MEEAQGTTGGVGRRHRPRGAVVEEAGASHASSMSSRSEVSSSDANVENGASAGSAQIRASERPGASAAENKNRKTSDLIIFNLCNYSSILLLIS